MRSTALSAVVVLFASALLVAQSSKPAQKTAQALTNADVIQMASAGLADDVIVAAIGQSPSHNFDLTPGGLVALKKGGVSDAVIRAMQGNPKPTAPAAPAAAPAAAAAPARPAAATPSSPSAEGRVPANVTAEDGLYHIAGAAANRIEAKTPYQTRSGSTLASKLTLGLKPARLNAMLPGLSADLQVRENPSFYLHVAPGESVGEYYLVKFTVKQEFGRRELEVGSASFYKVQAGFAEKDLFLLDTKRVQKDVYLVAPKAALPSGEYGLLQVPPPTTAGQTGLTPRKIFDFGVR